MELTEIELDGAPWWSVGFEAAGPRRRRRGDLEAAAAALTARPLPAGLDLSPRHSRSYAEWLSAGWAEALPSACGAGPGA